MARVLPKAMAKPVSAPSLDMEAEAGVCKGGRDGGIGAAHV